MLKFALKHGTRVGHSMTLLGDREDSVGLPALMYRSAMNPSADGIVPPCGACEWRKLSATSTMPKVKAARYALALCGRRKSVVHEFSLLSTIPDFCAKGPVTLRAKRRNKVKSNLKPTIAVCTMQWQTALSIIVYQKLLRCFQF